MERWLLRHRRRLTAIVAVGALFGTIAVFTLLRGVEQRDYDAPPGPGLTAAQVKTDEERLLGRTVQVRGEVTIAGEEALVIGDRELVIIPRRGDMIPELEIGDEVFATGTVRRFDVAALDPLTDADLDSAAIAQRPSPGDAVLLADSVVRGTS